MLKIAVIVDSNETTKYVYELAEWCQTQKNIQITHLIVQQIKNERLKIKKLYNIFKKNGNYVAIKICLFYLITKVESLILKNIEVYRNDFKKYDLFCIIKDAIYVDPMISKSGHVYRYRDEDIKKIQSFDFDILIRCGSGILRGDILNSSRLGIISFHHGDNTINRGGPAGFWEVYLKQDSTGFTIQQLTDELDGGNALFRGNIWTRQFYILNQLALYNKSNFYFKMILANIALKNQLYQLLPSTPYFNELYKIPGIAVQIEYVIKSCLALFTRAINKYFIKRKYRWGVAFKYNNWKSIVMWNSTKIKNPPNHYLADPFVVRRNKEDYCFVEDYCYETLKASICVYKLSVNKAERLGTAIEEPFHISYPYVFEYQSKLYMCPESANNKDIRIYECIDFPLKWGLKKVIFSDISAVDSTIFQYNGRWWLFTSTDSGDSGDYCSDLLIYYADNPFSDYWTPHKNNPIFVDSMKGRMGGILFDEKDVYRVSQQQGFNMYGKSTTINKIVQLTENQYIEESYVTIKPNFFKNIKGTHHIHSNGAVTVFDFVENVKMNT